MIVLKHLRHSGIWVFSRFHAIASMLPCERGRLILLSIGVLQDFNNTFELELGLLPAGRSCG